MTGHSSLRGPRPVRARLLVAGMSLPGLLVGLALGLWITAAAVSVVAVSGAEHRRMLAEARLHQDLRAAMDFVMRELRRSGQWPDATAGVWATEPGPSALAEPASEPASNPFGAFIDTPCNAASHAPPSALPPSAASYACHLVAAADDAVPVRTGFHVSRGVLYAVLQGSTPQALTDPAASSIRRFTVSSAGRDLALEAYCEGSCGDRCPRAALRALVVELQAALPDDPRAERRLVGTVRVRNDLRLGQCPTP